MVCGIIISRHQSLRPRPEALMVSDDKEEGKCQKI